MKAEKTKDPKEEVIFYGLPASPGVVHGPAFRFLHDDVEVLKYQVEESDHESEIERFQNCTTFIYINNFIPQSNITAP